MHLPLLFCAYLSPVHIWMHIYIQYRCMCTYIHMCSAAQLYIHMCSASLLKKKEVYKIICLYCACPWTVYSCNEFPPSRALSPSFSLLEERGKGSPKQKRVYKGFKVHICRICHANSLISDPGGICRGTQVVRMNHVIRKKQSCLKEKRVMSQILISNKGGDGRGDAVGPAWAWTCWAVALHHS